MTTVNIKRDELLTILRDNRAKHRAVFEEAITNYRTAAIAQLDSMIADAKSGKRIRRSLSLIEPMDQTQEYDRVIRMLELSVDETIGLDERQFSQYIMDKWSWKAQFSLSNASYVVSAPNKALLDDVEE